MDAEPKKVIEQKITDRLLNVDEVAVILGLTRGTVYHLVSERKLDCVRLSARCLRFQESAIRFWIDSLAAEGRAYTRRAIRRPIFGKAKNNDEGV